MAKKPPRGKTKPTGAVTLNRGSRFASRAIVWPFTSGNGRAALGEPGLQYGIAGSPTIGSFSGMEGVKFTTNSDCVTFPNTARLNTSSMTQLIVFRFDTLLSPSSTLSESFIGAGSSTLAMQFCVKSTGVLELVKDNVAIASTGNIPVYAAGTIGVAAVSYDGTTANMALNGWDVSASTTPQTFFRAGFQLMTKMQGSSSETPRPCEVFMFAYWPYAMARGDLAELTRNPWQLLGGNDRVFAVPPVVFDATVVANQATSAAAITGESIASANQVTSTDSVVSIGITATSTTNQVTSTDSVVSIGITAASTANQVVSASAAVTISTDATSTANQVTSIDSVAGAGVSVESSQVTSTSAAVTISTTATSSANQVVSVDSVAMVSTTATSSANQVVSVDSVATISTIATGTANQVTGTSSTATINIDATGTANQVTSINSSATVSVAGASFASQVTSVSASGAVILPASVSTTQVISTDSSIAIGHRVTVQANQVVTTASAIAKTGSVIRSPAKWRVMVAPEEDQVLVVRAPVGVE